MSNTHLITVTPHIAAEWLRLNRRNRNLNARLVSDYARDMANGKWVFNGEAIKRAMDGTLLDGQHRLAAIVESGIALEVLVVEGLDASAQDTMDSGRKRTTADVLAINGETNVNVLASVARRVWLWDTGNLKFISSQRPSTAELKDVLAKYPSLRRSADIGVRTNHAYRPASATVTGTVHHLVSQVPDAEADVAEFFARMASGADLSEGHPILTLRNRMMRDRTSAKNVPFHQGVGLYFRAWNAYREGRSLISIMHTAEEPMIKPV